MSAKDDGDEPSNERTTPLSTTLIDRSPPPPLNWATHPLRKSRAGCQDLARTQLSPVPPTSQGSPKHDDRYRAVHSKISPVDTSSTKQVNAPATSLGFVQPSTRVVLGSSRGSRKYKPASDNKGSSHPPSYQSSPSSVAEIGVGTPPPAARPDSNGPFYVVSVGRCVGVFDAYAYAKAMVSGLSSEATFQSFSTYEKAMQVYQHCKRLGILAIEREPNDGSEARFGPVSIAYQ
ncbi:hypothetical protein NLJ89_g10649 [Agrocybe chaxingu]|uniref:Ribonuclease H1 N-terminal domain-containing protein n=1 Tax=Agrocybe chaxingu TaxID=84603 RepID=A0A9W8JRD7_9AGAR|nr:hypothetical protein NLJ89_g10649 [Agrocybe chaxingu]